jgi:response regulator RpfG family c-di-GMP phosphodiesterase
MIQRPLSGLGIVILEDDYYQAQDCRMILEAAGAQVVAVSATIPDLDRLLAEGPVDLVLIDINLGHGMSFDFARTLKARSIPFLFLTGYDAGILPDDLQDSPHVGKPADGDRIVTALAKLAGRTV